MIDIQTIIVTVIKEVMKYLWFVRIVLKNASAFLLSIVMACSLVACLICISYLQYVHWISRHVTTHLHLYNGLVSLWYYNLPAFFISAIFPHRRMCYGQCKWIGTHSGWPWISIYCTTMQPFGCYARNLWTLIALMTINLVVATLCSYLWRDQSLDVMI